MTYLPKEKDRRIANLLFQIACQDFYRASETYGSPVEARVPFHIRNKMMDISPMVGKNKLLAMKRELMELIDGYDEDINDYNEDFDISDKIIELDEGISNDYDKQIEDEQIEDQELEDEQIEDEELDRTNILQTTIREVIEEIGIHNEYTIRDIRQKRLILRQEYKVEEVKAFMEWMVERKKMLKREENGTWKYKLTPKLG